MILPALTGPDASIDVLVRARPGAYELNYLQIRTELEAVLEVVLEEVR